MDHTGITAVSEPIVPGLDVLRQVHEAGNNACGFATDTQVHGLGQRPAQQQPLHRDLQLFAVERPRHGVDGQHDVGTWRGERALRMRCVIMSTRPRPAPPPSAQHDEERHP